VDLFTRLYRNAGQQNIKFGVIFTFTFIYTCNVVMISTPLTIRSSIQQNRNKSNSPSSNANRQHSKAFYLSN